jgi:hypothetical protein
MQKADMSTPRERALKSLSRGGRPVPVRRRAAHTGNHVIVSPRPMAHIADGPGSLQPICPHSSDAGAGWTASVDPWTTWATLHPDVPRCLTCVDLNP